MSSGVRNSRDTPVAVDPILAITPNGIIAKANLQARRALGRNETIEHGGLGSLLAHFIAVHDAAQGRLVLSIPNEGGEPRHVLLVLSEEEPVLLPEPQEEEPSVEAVASSSVADFIAHEVRNNIAIMMGFAELLGAGFDAMAADDRASVVQAIESEGEHALAVLDSLLKLVESRRHPEAAGTSVPLHSVVRRVIAEHKRRHPSRHLQVTGDGLVFANGNSSWIQIAVANLVSNAEKVTPEDQIIEVNVRQEAERALVTVLDKGNALAPPLYQDLWDIYSKGAPRGIEISGSGIGLSLCKELVAAMGGKVWAGPRSQGGSGFAISLNGRPQPSVSEIEMR